MNLSPRDILNHVLRSTQKVTLQGLQGTGKALILANLQKQLQIPVVIITSSFEKAEQLLEDLSWFVGEEHLYLFPQWDTLPYDNFSPHKETVAARFRTMNALIHQQVDFLVTTPTALMQQIMPKKEFIVKRSRFEVGVSFFRQNTLTLMKELGYSHVDVVEDRGEFSTHGKIVDVFPIDGEQPVRIEWKTQQIHTIHPFDVQTQFASTEQWKCLDLLPCSEVLFFPANLQQARKQLMQFHGQIPESLLRQMQNKLTKAQSFPGMESLLPLFYPSLDTLFHYFPEHSCMVLEEEDLLLDRAKHFYDEVFMEYELSLQQGNLTISPEDLYLSHRDLEQQFRKSASIVCTERRDYDTGNDPSFMFPFANNRSLRQGFEKAGSHSAVGYVTGLLKSWQEQGIPVMLNAKTQTAADHFRQLLGDLAVHSVVAVEKSTQLDWLAYAEGTNELSDTQSIPILIGKLSSGFRVLNDEGKVCFALLTEDEVFGEKNRKRRLQRAQVQPMTGTLDDLREGDLVVHLDYGIGQYLGLQKIPVANANSDFMVLSYARNEKVYVPVQKFHLVQKYVNADGSQPKLNKLGDKAWKKTRTKVAKAVEDIAHELTEIYATRKSRQGFSFPVDDHEMQEFELRFTYEETPDQREVIRTVKQDMENNMPMDRLVCGDVGFGKTEIAMRAAFKAVHGGKQVAILVPTTILAQQHYVSFGKRFEETAFVIEVLSRFRTTAEQKEIIKKVKKEQVDILIGTHRLLSSDVKFKNLGLLIVDEEQRFGVKHKEKIKQFRAEIDVLTLSATPIPRTLYMSLTGIRDLSIINTPPADRLAIRTRLLKANDYIIQEAVSREIRRGGQVFVVHNRVESIYQYGNYLKGILPNARIGVGHGQMSESQLEKLMLDFMDGYYDVLIATTIIESGLDIPRAKYHHYQWC